MKTVGLFFLLLAFVSCQPIAKLVLGVKKPKYENFETIQTYCISNNLDTANLYVPKQIWFKKKQNLKFSQKDSSNPKFGIPAVLAFDKNGNPLTLHNPGNCTPGAVYALTNLSSVDSTSSPENAPYADLPTFLSYFEGRNHAPVSFADIADGSDVYIAFFWPKYWPKATLEYYQGLQKLMSAEKGVKYKLIMFNGDFQQGGEEEKIKFSKK